MKRSALSQAFIALFLAVQIALPVRGVLRSHAHLSSDFSWNVYSTYDRFVASYRLVGPDGGSQPIDVERYFDYRYELLRVLWPDRLPRFHAWLCQRLREEGRSGQLRARVRFVSPHAGRQRLVRRKVDLCGAENYGVVAD